MTKDKLNIISADELLDTTYAPSGCLIERLMGRGIYILAGAPKVGKSWLVLWLTDKISKGEPVWNLKTEQGGVLYISLEDTYQRIQKRLNNVSGSKPGNIWFATEAEYIGCGFEVQLLNFLNEHPEVKLVREKADSIALLLGGKTKRCRNYTMSEFIADLAVTTRETAKVSPSKIKRNY